MREHGRIPSWGFNCPDCGQSFAALVDVAVDGTITGDTVQCNYCLAYWTDERVPVGENVNKEFAPRYDVAADDGTAAS